MQLERHCGCQMFVAEIKKALPFLEFGNKN
jgi:hypothetical protein